MCGGGEGGDPPCTLLYARSSIKRVARCTVDSLVPRPTQLSECVCVRGDDTMDGLKEQLGFANGFFVAAYHC